MVTDGAGVEEDGVGVLFGWGDGVSGAYEGFAGEFGVEFVHLATEGDNVYGSHGGLVSVLWDGGKAVKKWL